MDFANSNGADPWNLGVASCRRELLLLVGLLKPIGYLQLHEEEATELISSILTN